MNSSFYKKSLCLLLASSVTFGPFAAPLSAQAVEELAKEKAEQMAELFPAQESTSTPSVESKPVEENQAVPMIPIQPQEPADEGEPEENTAPEEKPQAEQDESEKITFKGKKLTQGQDVRVSASAEMEGYEAAKAQDEKAASAWRAEAKGKEAFLSYDLKGQCALEGVRVLWESTDAVKEYFVETSVDGTKWEEQEHRTAAPANTEETIAFDKAVDAQHIRLRVVTAETAETVGVQELEVYGDKKAVEILPAEAKGELSKRTNLALLDGVTATASDVEADTEFNADKARDGKRSGKPSRWATNKNAGTPITIAYDLGQTRTIGGVVIYWEQPSAQTYFVETSTDGQDWVVQKELTERVTENNLVEKIDFNSQVEARHIRVRIESYQNVTAWNNVSMYEFEVYQVAPSTLKEASTVINQIEPRIENGKVVVDEDNDFEVSFAANYEQVVGLDGTIYQPLIDMNVELNIQVVNKEDPKDTANKSVTLLIEGENRGNEGNAKPAVIPELTEWYSSVDQKDKTFKLRRDSQIVCTDKALAQVAAELSGDIEALFGFPLKVVSGGVKDGDIILTLDSQLAGFDKETYQMDVTDLVEIKATDATGVYWGTRSVLQALLLSGEEYAIAQGTAKDYPEFKLRGFMLDVGRKPFSMNMLREVVKNMSWFKLNDFHVHLSDNLIFMEDYVDSTAEEGWPNKAWEAYSGFRLEYTPGEDGRTPASKDYHYTKQEFRNFVEESKELGINIVPELDVPAHALPLTQTFRETALVKGNAGQKRPWIDHIDISKQENIDFIQTIYDNYLDDDTFAPNSTVHIGADEFYDSHDAYRTFVKQMIEYMGDKERTLRIWGSLTQMNSSIEVTPEEADGVQMNIWNTTWANPREMYENGFDLINTVDGVLYMVPNGNGGRGGYGDYLNGKSLYETWTPNNIGGTIIPAGSDQMLGATFAIWQDNIDTRAAGIDEVDTFKRFFDAIVPLSVKMWGEADALDRDFAEMQENAKIIGTAPNSNPMFEVENKAGTKETLHYDFNDTEDSSGNGRNLTLHNAELQGHALQLNGGASYAETGRDLNKLGFGNDLSFRVKKSRGGPTEQIIFEADHAYDEYTIKAIQDETNPGVWKLGFSRELYDYIFDVELPEDEWVTLTLHNADGNTMLFVNGNDPVSAVGSFLPDENSNTQFRGNTGITHSSFAMPIERIGSKKNAFIGLIDDVSVTYMGGGKNSAELDESDVPHDQMTAAAGSHQPNGGEAELAIDGDPNTLWHSNWDESCTPENAWLELTLNEPTEINALRYLPRSEGVNGIIKKYRIQVKENENDTWRDVATGTWSKSPGWKIAVFDRVTAKQIRLIGEETLSSNKTKFVSAAEVRVCKPVDLSQYAEISMLESSYPLIDGQATPKPIIKIKDGSILREGQDYTLSYENHTAVGTGTVTATGTRRFEGSLNITYRITELNDNSNNGGGGGGGGSKPDKPEKPDKKPEPKPEESNKPGTEVAPVVPIVQTVQGSPEAIKPFADVKTHWGQDAIAWAVTNHLFSGVSETSFAPDDAMTRGMLVTVLHRLSGTPAPSGSHAFADVPANAYFEKAVAWASNINLILGVGEQKFAPNANITREQLAVTLYKFAGQPKSSGNQSAGFKDAARISDWAKPAMEWALSAGLLQGAGDSTLAPQQQATRAQVATILMRFEQVLKK